MNLYEIDKRIADVIENGFSVNEDSGELLFTEEDLNALEIAKESKIENIALYIKNLTVLADGMEAEIKSITERKKRLQAKIENLKGYIGGFVEKEFSTAKCQVKCSVSHPLEITDEKLIPKQFIKVVEKESIDKVAIKEVIKNGGIVEGCLIADKKNVRVL